MSLSSGLEPLNAFSLRTPANFSTVRDVHGQNLGILVALFLLACVSTLTIWSTQPVAGRVYECCVLLIAAWLLGTRTTPIGWRLGTCLCALPLWGFLQLALGATVYRFATLQSALQLAALSATAWIAYCVARHWQQYVLQALAWLGFGIAMVSVLAYFTSPRRILWLIDAPYPDTWGPFLSRNNFAQFLELMLPAALWLAFQRRDDLLYWSMSATMLASGLISASRAGAGLLCLEVFAAFLCAPRLLRRFPLVFVATALLIAGLGGASTLLGRFASDPLAQRDQLYRSSLAMIAERPWTGYGMGTFALVYPEFAKFDSGYSVEHAHNDWLEWSTEGGLAFTAVWAALFLPSLPRIRAHFWALGIPAILLHAAVDFPFVRLGIAAWIFILLGLLESSPPPQLRRTT